jgi:sulfite exporter TauE/SafE
LKIYIDLFITGVALSWGPCLCFCAPILLPYIAGTQKGWAGGLKISLAFSLARIVPYVILSLISATLGQYLITRFYDTQGGMIIHMAAGILIVFLGIVVVIGKSGHLHFCASLKRINSSSSIKEMMLLGMIVGFAPCLPLFGVLAYIAFNAQNFLHGAMLGLTFGLGTVVSPLILIGPLVGEIPALLLKRPLVYKIFSRLCGLILMYLGIEMLARVLGAV